MEQTTHQDILAAVRATDARLQLHDTRLAVVERIQLGEQEERRAQGHQIVDLAQQLSHLAAAVATQGGRLQIVLALLTLISGLELWALLRA